MRLFQPISSICSDKCSVVVYKGLYYRSLVDKWGIGVGGGGGGTCFNLFYYVLFYFIMFYFSFHFFFINFIFFYFIS